MTDIIIYTKPETLEHKLELAICYWDLPTTPQREIEPYESYIYFATKGFIRGKFVITDVEDRTIEFESWEPLDKLISCKPFQGFKYFD